MGEGPTDSRNSLKRTSKQEIRAEPDRYRSVEDGIEDGQQKVTTFSI